jgi:aspartate kinase
MIQQGAISFEAVVDSTPEKIEKVKGALADKFKIEIQEGLTILTIRHFNDEVINKHKSNRKTLLEQRTTDTYQGLLV